MTPTDRLVRRLAALREPRQRVAILAEQADELGPEVLVEIAAELVRRADAGGRADDQDALSTVIDYLASEHVDDARKLALLAAARDRGHEDVLQLLVTPPPHRVDEEDRQVPDYGAGRLLTLGERKALARRPDRKVLEKVMTDPHPAVIHNLLVNPKLVEADVLRLVTRRPSREDVLAEVYRSRRWIARYVVKVALVRNPYTPPWVSLKLLPLLLRQDVEEAAGARELHPSVRLACRRLLVGFRRDEPGEDSGDEPGPTLH